MTFLQSRTSQIKCFLEKSFSPSRWILHKSLIENLDELKKIVSEFKNLGEKLVDENEAYVLLNSLPDACKNVKNTLKYGRESITTDAIISALKTNELEFQVTKREHPSA